MNNEKTKEQQTKSEWWIHEPSDFRLSEKLLKFEISVTIEKSGWMKMSASAIANKLPADILKEIEYWSKKEKTDTNSFIVRLIDEGLREWKIHKVLRMYKNQEITLWKAAEIAGVSLAELLSELPKQKIVFQYDMEELKEDLEYARGK